MFLKIAIINVCISFIFVNINNKSNFSKKYYIPVMASIITKYVGGDFDKGYKYTANDIVFWIYNGVVSYLAVILFEKFK